MENVTENPDSESTQVRDGDAPAPPDSSPSLQLSAIHAASQRLLRVQQPDELATDIIEILEHLLSYDYLAVMLVDASSTRLLPYAISDQGKGTEFLAQDKAYITAADIEIGHGITGWVAEHGKSALIGDVRFDPRYMALRDGIRSELCVPLLLDGRVSGVINIETSRPSAYSITDQQVLETVAAQIAVAIDNARLFSEASESRRDKLMAEIAGGVAHDLGNILLTISVDTYLLMTNPAISEEERDQLKRILTAAQQGSRLARRMLHAGRALPYVDEQSSTSDVGDVLRDNAALICAIAGGDTNVEINISDQPLPVNTPPAELEQLILNLVVNACQAMPSGGRLSIEATAVSASNARPGQALLRVTDTGCGMPEEVSKRAFDPLFTTRTDGSGLGLAMVARIAEAAGGRATINSVPAKGSTVSVHLDLRATEPSARA